MKTTLKTLTLITTGFVVGVVVGRVGINDRFKNKLNTKEFSPINLDVSQLEVGLSDATILGWRKQYV